MNELTYEGKKVFYLPYGGELKVNASGKGERRGGKRSLQTPERCLQRVSGRESSQQPPGVTLKAGR